MTRTLQVVNLSNWDGEDYEVTVPNYLGEPKSVTLKPGQSISIQNQSDQVSGSILFRPIQRRDPETGQSIDTPFYDDEGNQVMPHMEVSFRKA